MSANKKQERIVNILILFLLALAFISQTVAFTGTSNGIETTFSLGTISTITNNSTGSIGTLAGGTGPVGSYDGAYGGFFGLLNGTQNAQNNNSGPITIFLLTPIDNSGTNDTIATFRANIAGNQIENCSLMIDGIPDTTVSWPSAGNIDFTTTLAIGRYNWSVACFDNLDQQYNSDARIITIIQAYDFDAGSTDFTTVNIEDIPNLTIAKSNLGKIRFDTNTNMSGGADLNNNIIIGQGSIYVNTNSIPQLNKSATLTMYNLGLQHPIILRDGIVCSDCTVLSYNDTLVFNVLHFSTYTVSENSALGIWDETDISTKYIGNMVKFYANYTNLSSRQILTGGNIDCSISFPDLVSTPMQFNSTLALYVYNRSFTAEGIHEYNITCDDTNDIYARLSLLDSSIISSLLGPQAPSNITVVTNDRANITSNPEIGLSHGGNVTHLNVDSLVISPSWQGYYGNISGNVALENPQGGKLYDWKILEPQGEIYATRAYSVDFSSIGCIDDTQVSSEEAFIGQSANDTDSVRNTFNRTAHPSFKVGAINISSNQCRSINLYVSGAPQTLNFYEVLMSDQASNILYTAIIDANQIGFDGSLYDFQMLVGEDGHNDYASTPYYFFLDLS